MEPKTAVTRHLTHGESLDAESFSGGRLDQQFFAERIDRLFRGSRVGFLVEPASAALLALALWGSADREWATLWLVLVWAMAALRAVLWQRYARSDHGYREAAAWLPAFSAVSWAGAALWGAGLGLLWPVSEPTLQVVLLAAIVSVAVVSSMAIAIYMPTVYGYWVALLLTAIASLYWRDAEYITIAATGAIAIAILIVLVAGRLSRVLQELMRMRFELAAVKDSAQTAARAKSEFIANMSHELRTPLNAIIGFSEIMKTEAFGPIGAPKYLDYASDIHSSGSHLLNIINDILDLSKIEAGKMEIRNDLVDVAQVIDAAASIVQGGAKSGGVKFTAVVVESVPTVRGDERALKQVLLNLMSNAIKFTPLGGEVTVHAGCSAAGGVDLKVTDTGMGMTPEEIETALEPFGQVDSSLSRKYEGTGLGLPLVKSLVALHGGDFTIESEPGIGTTATVWLPAQPASSAERVA